MDNALLRTLERRDALTLTERSLLDEMTQRERSVPPGTDLVREGDTPRESCLMLSGLSARYNMVGDGKRQITAIHIAGDFVDLHSLLLARMDHSVTTLTDCRVAIVPHALLRRISESEPHLTRLLWMLTVIDAGMFRQSLVAAASLPARGQIARFLCEMYVRLSIVGLTLDHEFDLAINQSELGDVMGLSVVHVNRSLQALRREGLISWQGARVRILDWALLSAEAEFDDAYLNIGHGPR